MAEPVQGQLDVTGPPPVIWRDAAISEDGLYRYWLTRRWDTLLPRCVFVMLNPSTADAMLDDPTIRRCSGFAQRWGFGSVDVVNLYAWRATNPRDLPTDEAIASGGDLNDWSIRRAISAAALVIAAWGGKAQPTRAAWAAEYLPAGTKCLAHLRDGVSPQHPLYVLGDTVPIPWRPAHERS